MPVAVALEDEVSSVDAKDGQALSDAIADDRRFWGFCWFLLSGPVRSPRRGPRRAERGSQVSN